MVRLPVRGNPVFAATEKFTGPLPDPELPEVIVIHAALLTAVQVQPVGAVTFVLAEPLMEATETELPTDSRQATPSREPCTTPGVVGKCRE